MVAERGAPSCRCFSPPHVGRAGADLSAGQVAAQHGDMSRAFVKESDGAEGEELAELQVSPHRNLVTPEGLALIEATVERLRAELSASRAAEDRAGSRRIQRDLRYWTERQRTAEPVRPAGKGGKVRFGSVVTLVRGDGTPAEYRIVGEDEADPAAGKISWVSPIAKRLIGTEAGDEVELPDGAAEVRAVG
jgi:transcription elongation GreA/GreB family factor